MVVLDDETEAIAAGCHRYEARRTDAGRRFGHLVVTLSHPPELSTGPTERDTVTFR